MTLSTETNAHYGRVLREAYERMIAQDIPERFRKLLERLETAANEEKAQAGSGEASTTPSKPDAVVDHDSRQADEPS